MTKPQSREAFHASARLSRAAVTFCRTPASWIARPTATPAWVTSGTRRVPSKWPWASSRNGTAVRRLAGTSTKVKTARSAS